MSSKEVKQQMVERRAELQHRRDLARQNGSAARIRNTVYSEQPPLLAQRTVREQLANEHLQSQLAMKDALQSRKAEIDRRAAEAAKRERQSSHLWHSPNRGGTSVSSCNSPGSSSPTVPAVAAASPIADSSYERLMGRGINKVLVEHQLRQRRSQDRLSNTTSGLVDTYVIQSGTIAGGQAPLRWK